MRAASGRGVPNLVRPEAPPEPRFLTLRSAIGVAPDPLGVAEPGPQTLLEARDRIVARTFGALTDRSVGSTLSGGIVGQPEGKLGKPWFLPDSQIAMLLWTR